jgi:hypothetical protein
LVVLLAVFVATIFTVVEYSFQHSDVYIYAVSQAKTNPFVVGKIGQPLKIGWLTTGSINNSGPSGRADIAIPISGPQGKGTIYVVAKKSAGEWKFDTLQVEIVGESQRIELLPERQRPQIEQQGGRATNCLQRRTNVG